MYLANLAFVLLGCVFDSAAYHTVYLRRNGRIIIKYDKKNENNINDNSRESNKSTSLLNSWWASFITPKIERDIKSSSRYADYYIGRRIVKQAKNIVDNARQILGPNSNVDNFDINQTSSYVKFLKLGINPLESSKLLGNLDDKLKKYDKSNVYASLNTFLDKAKYDGQRIKRKINLQSGYSSSIFNDNFADPINSEEPNKEIFNIEPNIMQFKSEDVLGNATENLLDKVETLKLIRIQFNEMLIRCNEVVIKENLDASSSNYIYIQVFIDDIVDGIRAIDRILLIAIKKSVINISAPKIASSDDECAPAIKNSEILDIYSVIENILLNYNSNSKNNNGENLNFLSLIKIDDLVERDGILMKCYIPLYGILAGILNIDVSSKLSEVIGTSNSLCNKTIDTTVASSAIAGENFNGDELLSAISKLSRDSLEIAAGLGVTSVKAIANVVTGFSKQAVNRIKSDFYLKDPSFSVMISDKNSTNKFRKERWNLVGTLDADEDENIADLYDD